MSKGLLRYANNSTGENVRSNIAVIFKLAAADSP